MYNFIIAAEGQTDIDALQVILQGLATEYKVKCDFPPAIFPSSDATSGCAGWTRLKTFCEEYRGQAAKTDEQMAKDTTLFAQMNMTSPPQYPNPRWGSLKAFHKNPILVFHLDGDIAEELTTHHPKGTFATTEDRGQYCRKALQHWTGLKEDEALWCVPVQCLETWFLTLHSLSDCQKYRLYITSLK